MHNKLINFPYLPWVHLRSSRQHHRRARSRHVLAPFRARARRRVETITRMGHRLYRPRTTPVIQTIIVIAASKEDLLHQPGVSKVEARRRTIIKAFTLTAVLSGANVNVIGAILAITHRTIVSHSVLLTRIRMQQGVLHLLILQRARLRGHVPIQVLLATPALFGALKVLQHHPLPRLHPTTSNTRRAFLQPLPLKDRRPVRHRPRAQHQHRRYQRHQLRLSPDRHKDLPLLAKAQRFPQQNAASLVMIAI